MTRRTRFEIRILYLSIFLITNDQALANDTLNISMEEIFTHFFSKTRFYFIFTINSNDKSLNFHTRYHLSNLTIKIKINKYNTEADQEGEQNYYRRVF